jgi:hypothetical protein
MTTDAPWHVVAMMVAARIGELEQFAARLCDYRHSGVQGAPGGRTPDSGNASREQECNGQSSHRHFDSLL